VREAGVALQVPADWPVYLLAGDPARCVRVDVHAVYVGVQGSAAQCPAKAVGRSESVEIAPPSADTGASNAAPPAVTHEFVQRVPGANQVVTVTFGNDEALAARIAGSVKAAS
jgi:hypothetical protein